MAKPVKLNEDSLLNLKAEIREAKTRVSELTGQKQILMKQLKDDWKCSDIDQATKKLKTMRKEAEETELLITKGTKILEDKLNENNN